ncbi:MAG: MFS transporter [Thaumarchaeota archaeon]|nr:MFS transporter [Nitrososphaerota archaeon]
MSGRDGRTFISFYSAFYVARGFAGLIIPLYFVSVGIPVIGVGVAIGVFGASLLIFEILWGVLLDRMGPDRLVFAAVALNAVTYVLVPFVKTPEGAVITEFVLGASGPILAVVARSGVIRQRESGGWASGFGLLGGIYAVSQLVGSLLGGAAAPSIGFADSFYLTAGISVAAYVFYLRFVRRGPTTADTATHVAAPAIEPRPPLDWRGLPLLGLVAVPTFIGFAFFTNIIQLVVIQTPRISGTDFEAGIVVSCFWLSTAIFQPLLSRRGANNARRWIGLALVASFGVFALMTQFYSVWEIAAGAFLEGACFSAISPLSLSLLMVGIPKRFAGRAMGIYGAAEDVGIIIGPIVGSAVWVEFGLTPAYLTIGAAYLAVFVPYAAAMRRSRSRLKR